MGNATDERPRVPRVKRLRGLRDIHTIGTIGSARANGPSAGHAPAARLGLRTRTRIATVERAPVERPRAWVFVRRPRFARHQGMLLVEPLEEPTVEIFEEGAALVVLAELSGVNQADVEVRVSGDILVIAARGARGAPRYHGEILLPFAVASQPIELALRNGVLEIGLQREHRSVCRTAADRSEET